MRQYRIQGGNTRIFGELKVGGAKNAVLPIIAAMCLNESESVIHNCPRIADTFVSLEILDCMGYKTEFVGNTLKVGASTGLDCNIPDECINKMRSSILFMGAMLARCGKIDIALPGGCELGNRAIDLHISGLRAMGANIHLENGKLYCTADKLKGTKISLHTASVGATENLMIAAVKAEGETIIENAAREPEIVDLARFLKGIGAKIRGEGTSTIIISGVEHLHQFKPHHIMPDRIVAGTYLVAAAITGGELTLTDTNPIDMLPIITPLAKMDCEIRIRDNSISLSAPPRLQPLPHLMTKIHPGFPTDMQPQFVAALTIAEGQSIVTETIFDKRHQHAYELNKMGAEISLSPDNQVFTINGVNRLCGTTVAAKDLRGGAALILAALAAEGETIVQNAEYVERGYEHIEKDLCKLGADITFETEEN